MRGKYLYVVAIASLVMAALVASGPLQGGGGKETGESVLKQLQGTWKFIAQEMDGKTLKADDLKGHTITFTGDKWSVQIDGKEVQAGTHKFDPSKKPGQVDAKVTDGQDKGSTMLGIYETAGDTFKVCFDPQGKARPTSFTAKAGQFSATIQREKKK